MSAESSPPTPLRTLGVLGDIHAEDTRLAAALDHLRASSVDRIVSVGDIVDGPGDFVRTCALLRAASVDTVRGNHERWLLAGTMRDLPDALPTADLGPLERHFVTGLPLVREYHTAAGLMLLCHGLGPHDMQTVHPDDSGYALEYNDALQALIAERRYRFVVCGHSHQRMVRGFGQLTVVNAGTLYRDHEPCFARIDCAAGEVEFHDLRASATGVIEIVGAGRYPL